MSFFAMPILSSTGRVNLIMMGAEDEADGAPSCFRREKAMSRQVCARLTRISSQERATRFDTFLL